jgi:hypothetical protein
MKKILIFALMIPFFSCEPLQQSSQTSSSANTTQSKIAEALKQALTIGTQNSANKLS